MKRHGENLNTYDLVKEANLQRLHTIWFQLEGIQEKTNLWKQQKQQWLEGIKYRWGINRVQTISGQWNYSVWYYNGYILLSMCQSPQNGQFQEWT